MNSVHQAQFITGQVYIAVMGMTFILLTGIFTKLDEVLRGNENGDMDF